jgi:hypothetical protein
MRAREYVAIEPLHEAPTGDYVDYGHREEALSDALRGVAMGGYDALTVGRLVRHLDDPTLRALVSLIERARGASMLAVVELEAVLQELNARRQREQAYGAARGQGS